MVDSNAFFSQGDPIQPAHDSLREDMPFEKNLELDGQEQPCVPESDDVDTKELLEKDRAEVIAEDDPWAPHDIDLVNDRLDHIDEVLTKLEAMFTSKIDRSEYELESLKKQSEEIQEYKADLHASILTPVLKPLTRMHAFMKRALEKAHAENADTIPLDEFEFAFDDLTEVIEDNGIEIRNFEIGSFFEASVMKITGQKEVAEQDKNKTLDSISSDAYLFKGTVLEKARVIVNVYADSQRSSE